jgi:hypothetical protein
LYIGTESRGSFFCYTSTSLILVLRPPPVLTLSIMQKMVMSLSCDKAVWNAVMNNEAVQDFRRSLHDGMLHETFMYMHESYTMFYFVNSKLYSDDPFDLSCITFAR